MPYKATYNYKCLDQTYEIGQEYKIDKYPILCVRGFHYCNEAKNTLAHYNYNSRFKLLEIEDLNPSDTIREDKKSCSNHIRIIREITDPDELINLLGMYKTFDNQLGKVLTHKYLNGYSFEYTYNEFGDLLTQKESSGYYYSYTYNEDRKILTYSSKLAQGNEFSYENTYDKFGNELTHKDSNGYWSEYVRDEFGNQIMFKTSNTVDESK